MSKYCLIDENQYRPGNEGGRFQGTQAYTSRCIDYVNGLIEKYSPHAFIITSGSELDIEVLHGEIIDYLVGYPVHVFSPAWPANYPKPEWVTHHIYQGYDHVLFQHNYYWLRHNSLPIFEESITPDWYKKLSPDLLYTCYNNQPRDYRHYTIDQLYKHELLEKGIVTAKYSTVDQVAQPDYMPTDSWPFKYVPPGTQLVDESDFLLNTTTEFGCHEFPKSYSRGAIDIVTESRIDKNEFYLSEKTNKSLLAHKPFLVVGCQGYHKWLQKERGIELYTELFNYSFDDEADYQKRIDGIINNVKRLSEKYTTPEDYQKLYDSVKEKAERNFFRHMYAMVSGKNTQSLNTMLGLDPVNNSIEDYHRDKRSDYFHNCVDGDDIDRHFNFYYQYVMPQYKKTHNWMKNIKDIIDLII